MRRRLVALLAITAAACAGVAGATDSRDLVVGSGIVTFPDFPVAGESTTEQFSVSATAGPSGASVRGTIVQHSPHGDLRVDVTCLVIEGDTAIVGGTIVAGDYLGETFPRTALLIETGAEGTNGGDALTGLIFRTAWADPCARLVELREQFPGSIVPLPLDQGAFTIVGAA